MRALPAIALIGMAGCVTVPSGPSVMVLPGDGRTFDQFRYDEGDCRNFASSQIGGATAEQAAADSAVKSAVVGTLIGAAAGAVIGGNSRGTAIGAGSGLLIGSAAGSGAAQGSAYGLQRRYDMAFQQCMYAKGHRIAGSGRAQYPYAPAPMGYAQPPAPPGYPPPPAPPPR
ncbi:MAG: YMGG-like glycine zipper-containing protein [Casimicrobiaceae bacterium]